MKTFRSLNMRFQREQNKLRDKEDIEVRQAKRYRTYDYKDSDANNSHDGHANDNDNDDGVSFVMDAAKMVMVGKEDIGQDKKQHDNANTLNENCEEEKLWFVDESSFGSDSAGQSDSNSDDGKLMSVDCGEDDYQYKALYVDFKIVQYIKVEIEKRYVMRSKTGNVNASSLFHSNNKSCHLSTAEAHTFIQNFIATESLKLKSIDNLLVLLQSLLPGANLPEKLRLTFDSFSLDEESKCIFKFHCCPCGKTVYVCENKTAVVCTDPNCIYKNRYTEDMRNRTALRELNYRSLSLLVCELLHTKCFVKAISYKSSTSREGVLDDILDGHVARRHLSEMHDKFLLQKETLQLKTNNSSNIVEVSLLFSIYYDGAQLFKKSTTPMWPLMLSILNLPPPLRKARGKGLFMLSLFTGNTGSNCETFIIENLVNELVFLDKGFSVTINKTVYIIQARLIMHCYDSRALESVVKVQGAGSYAGCPLCGLCEG